MGCSVAVGVFYCFLMYFQVGQWGSSCWFHDFWLTCRRNGHRSVHVLPGKSRCHLEILSENFQPWLHGRQPSENGNDLGRRAAVKGSRTKTQVSTKAKCSGTSQASVHLLPLPAVNTWCCSSCCSLQCLWGPSAGPLRPSQQLPSFTGHIPGVGPESLLSWRNSLLLWRGAETKGYKQKRTTKPRTLCPWCVQHHLFSKFAALINLNKKMPAPSLLQLSPHTSPALSLGVPMFYFHVMSEIVRNKNSGKGHQSRNVKAETL